MGAEAVGAVDAQTPRRQQAEDGPSDQGTLGPAGLRRPARAGPRAAPSVGVGRPDASGPLGRHDLAARQRDDPKPTGAAAAADLPVREGAGVHGEVGPQIAEALRRVGAESAPAVPAVRVAGRALPAAVGKLRHRGLVPAVVARRLVANTGPALEA